MKSTYVIYLSKGAGGKGRGQKATQIFTGLAAVVRVPFLALPGVGPEREREKDSPRLVGSVVPATDLFALARLGFPLQVVGVPLQVVGVPLQLPAMRLA